MNDDQAPIEAIEAGAAGAPEGTPPVEPTTDEVGKMYKELGIKAPAPTGKPKGRPKSTKVRAEDVSDKDADDTKSGRKNEAKGSEDKPKDAPTTDKNGDSGDDTDSKSKEVSKDSAEVSDESEKADGGVREDESKSEGDSEPGSEEDSDNGDDGTSEDEDEAGKRPGKSNPKIEQRFQKLTNEVKERDELIERLQRELQETTRQQEQAKIAEEDPEYTMEDFRKVRDEDGNILDLDDNEAELAWRRWQDGYNQRKSEREARYHYEQEQARYQEEQAQKLMQSSVEAYDTLTGILDSHPELNPQSPEFDQDFSDSVLPIIEDSILYQPGTEPGNDDNLQPVIVGFKVNPKGILDAMNRIKNSKRSLPLNGVNDNVDVRSNVNVPHSRSSDPTVNAANELYRELGINKRV